MKIRATLTLKNNDMIAARERIGLTQYQAAELAGVGKTFYCDLERLNYRKVDEAMCSDQCVAAVAIALCLDEQQVYPDDLRGKRIISRHVRIADMPSDQLLDMSAVAASLPSPMDATDERDIKMIVHDALNGLDEIEKNVIEWHFGIGQDDPLTFKECGKLLGVTGERVRKVEVSALKKLHDAKTLEKTNIKQAVNGVTIPAREWKSSGMRKKCKTNTV